MIFRLVNNMCFLLHNLLLVWEKNAEHFYPHVRHEGQVMRMLHLLLGQVETFVKYK